MSTLNNSVMVGTTDNFHCCCSIRSDDFYTKGTTGIHIFNSIVLVPTSILATVGNLLVLVSIWRTPCLHSPSHVLLFGLAVSDLGVGLVVEPIAFVYNIAKIQGMAQVFCNSAVALSFTGALLCVASLLTITAISVDMYIAVYLHLRYQEIVTMKRMTGVLVGIWMSSITISLLYTMYWKSLDILWIIFILLCILVTTSAYLKLFQIVCHHQEEIDSQAQVREQAEDQDEDPPSIAQHRKSLMNKFLIYCLFAFCYLPFTVLAAVPNVGSYATNRALLEISLVFIYLNSSLNPFVYCWRFRKIRTAVIETTKKYCD